jgi:Transposase DDE domain group 1
MARPAENVVAFYNKRGTCEQWMKEGKGAIKWTRLSCRSFAANAVRLQRADVADFGMPEHHGSAPISSSTSG